MELEVFDDDLSPELIPKKKTSETIDYTILKRFIESKFPIYKTDMILKVAEYWKNLPNHQTEYDYYAGRLSDEDLDLLFEGIKISTSKK